MSNPSYGRVFNSFQELYNAMPADLPPRLDVNQPVQQRQATASEQGVSLPGFQKGAPMYGRPTSAVRTPVAPAQQQKPGVVSRVGGAIKGNYQAAGRAIKGAYGAAGRGLKKAGKFAYDTATDPFGRARKAEDQVEHLKVERDVQKSLRDSDKLLSSISSREAAEEAKLTGQKEARAVQEAIESVKRETAHRDATPYWAAQRLVKKFGISEGHVGEIRDSLQGLMGYDRKVTEDDYNNLLLQLNRYRKESPDYKPFQD